MMKIKFTGHSDDIIKVYSERHVSYCDAIGDSYTDEEDQITLGSSDTSIIRVQNTDGSQACNVIASYADNGTWHFAIGLIEEGRKLPPWEFTIDQPDQDYSTRLTIESKDDLIYIE